MNSAIQSVELTYLVHETEDAGKVRLAAAKAFALSCEPETEMMEGHFGNAIAIVRFHLTGREAAVAFESMISGLQRPFREDLAEDPSSYLDEHSALILRFDKQRLVRGELAIKSAEPVRMKVKPRAFLMKGGAKEFYAKLLGVR